MQTEFLVLKKDARAGQAFKAHKDLDVGYDLEVWYPDVEVGQPIFVIPNSFIWLPTGLVVKVGNNAWGCIRPRSSTFMHRQLFVMEGTIDPGYTGDLFICVFNPNSHKVIVKNGDRLAQLIPIPRFDYVTIREVDKMPITERGPSGFGSSGGITLDQ